MLIINADDLGLDEYTTRCILHCHQKGRISSASALVFMQDSAEAARNALEAGLDVGLHLNFTDRLSGMSNRILLHDFHGAVAGFLDRTRRCPFYNPMLRRHFDYLFHAQFEEFVRLYRRKPSHVDGHKHMHLCVNMVVDRVIPAQNPIRRSFHFFRGEKGVAKRMMRKILNGWVSRNYRSTDYFFDVQPMDDERIGRIMEISRVSSVELMVHPGRRNQLEYLLSDRFGDSLQGVRVGTWKELATRPAEPVSP